MSKRILGAFLLLFFCVSGGAAERDELSRLGKGTAIVFSPDFADPENRELYERLGFLYLESPSWREVLTRIREHNADRSNQPVKVLIVESHGTNGNGLKLQASKKAWDARSYISIGALQENLEDTGVEWIVLSACNAGRLLRPEIYESLDRSVDDPLFLPATLGILDASPFFNRSRSHVNVIRRAQSNLETLLHGSTDELSPVVRMLLHDSDETWRFAVSSMLIQILTRDPALELVDHGFVREKSREEISVERNEQLFQAFCRALESRVAGQRGSGSALETLSAR